MNALFLQAASIFSPAQLSVIIVISVLLACAIAANVTLYILFRKKAEHKLSTAHLQQRREDLLARIEAMKSGVYEDLEPVSFDYDDEDEEDDDEDEEDEKDDGVTVESTETFSEGEVPEGAEILAVADMSDETRLRLNVEDEEYDRKRYYVRYKLGFEAKLLESDEETKERYKAVVGEITSYKGVKLNTSFRSQRIYKGRKTLAIMLFRGKTLCVAFALNPADYEGTKYAGIDKSDKKRFGKTPLLYKLTSSRKVEYAKYLLLQLAENNSLVVDSHYSESYPALEEKTKDELFIARSLKITVLGEAPELELTPEPELMVEETIDGTVLTSTSDEADDVIAVDTPEGKLVFNRSFTARVIQADVELKARYSELKNYLLAYKGVRDRISWRHETYTIGRQTVATIAIRGKTLYLYLATDPDKFGDTKYRVENMSEQSSKKKTPLLFRVNGDRRTAHAKQLIDMVMLEHGAVRYERRPVDYAVPFKSTNNLVKRGLIRISQGKAFTRPTNKKD